ncbi:hypothetical protein J5N97_028707 [Dioscorea zingiberensis]|uniref:NAC domain-containing protein n=1 Tax=Dioscorea zingiberensis TaxID=325984 RepID=A0A9D5H541_9LILI|nr:hypothetical protein J5N97_028707 [Dioscorea zingiberensis]
MNHSMNFNPNATASSRLSPGFRFHPTDEELVGYYLKRKVLGRPIAVDAIAEVDLYKHEPSDLPAMSRIQSRDMEWYFFSSLDRKYSNRSRTNRATGGGYWKTTGKDRPVLHRSRIVGMKKTLVYHAGRAPRGQRTNWVMHEYRLDGEGLKLSGVSQDGYVVCRIFQKSGNGPMNGAQYGAPFIEEEWEGADEMAIKSLNGDGDVDGLVSAGGLEYVHMDDIMQDPDEFFAHENTDEQVNGSQLENSTTLPEDIVRDQSYIGDVDGCQNLALVEHNPILTAGIGGNPLILDQSCAPPSKNDGYVELNDFLENLDQNQPNNDSSADCIEGACNENFLIGIDEHGDLPEIDIDEFFDMLKENDDIQELFQMSPTVQNDVSQANYINSVSGGHPDANLAENNLDFYDALNQDIPFAQDNFEPMNDSCPSIADLCEFDKVDEMMGYFDTTDNDFAALGPLAEFQHGDTSNFKKSNFANEFGGTGTPTHDASQQASGMDAGIIASSSVMLSAPDDRPNGKKDDLTVKLDVEKTFTKRIANMLGSIPAPPALAAEYPYGAVKSVEQNSTAISPSSINFTTGMIHISSFTVSGTANQWSLQKNVDVGVLFSYTVGKSTSLTKTHGGFTGMILRSRFYLVFFSTLVLAAIFKIGLCVCTR